MKQCLKKISILEFITFILITFNICYISIGWNRVIHPFTHISINIGIFLLLLLSIHLSNRTSVFIWSFIRKYHPLFLIGYFFEASTALNHVVFNKWIDPCFIKIDQMIWGYQPCIEWGVSLDIFWVQELLHFAYFSYYIMIYGTPIILYLRKKYLALNHFMFTMAFTFYCCFIIYSFLPVIGGRYFSLFSPITEIFRHGIFTKLMAFVYRNSPHLGGAFPSSHVAISVVITIISIKYEKIYGYLLIPLTFLLTISTVYCHYHYFIDSLAGLIFAVVAYWISAKIYEKNKKSFFNEVE